MDAFKPYLALGLKNYQEHQVGLPFQNFEVWSLCILKFGNWEMEYWNTLLAYKCLKAKTNQKGVYVKLEIVREDCWIKVFRVFLTK